MIKARATAMTTAVVLLALSSISLADPCLVVYPAGPCEYRYDPDEYYTVSSGDSLYDPYWDRGGEVLLETGTDETDYSIYQAPGLSSFEPSYDGMHGYVFYSRKLTLVIDGFSNVPVTYDDVFLVFENLDTGDCGGTVVINGTELEGYLYNAGSLAVTTPTAEGNNYSDVITLEVEWIGCLGTNVWAFADTDGNGVFDGGNCFSAFSHDVTIGTETSSWGGIKSMYR